LNIWLIRLSEKTNKKEAMKLIDKIKDKKLKEYLKVYAQFKYPSDLLKILNYFDIATDTTLFDYVITDFRYNEGEIWLGAFVQHDTIYSLKLRIYDDYSVFEMYKIYLIAPI